jgi:ribonucleoside-diphosphate reductase beta chain
MSLVQERLAYKPFGYPWAYDLWKKQQQVHWLPSEVPLADDILDWERNLTERERNLLTHIFRFFTQSDIEVNNCYHRHYLRVFKPTEVVMMLVCFSNMETIHTDAYSHLLETIGMPATDYDAFLQYGAMKEKFDFMRSFNPTDPMSMAETMAAFGGFTEGLQLFASFAILLNFPRFNKMKGMGQIVTWSVRDETIHCEGITRLYHAWCEEHGLVGNTELARRIVGICEETVRHEDAFIDLAFEMGEIEGLNPEDVKKYIRYIADIRLGQLKLPALYGITRNPLPWLTDMLNSVEHANFFEARATEYSRGATTGGWDDGFD